MDDLELLAKRERKLARRAARAAAAAAAAPPDSPEPAADASPPPTKKRKRASTTGSAAPRADEAPAKKRRGAAASSTAADAAPRGVKDWRDPAAGAPDAGDGRYVHTWQEDRAPGRVWRKGKFTPEEDALVLEAFDEYCTEHGLDDDARASLAVDGARRAAKDDGGGGADDAPADGGAHSGVWKAVSERFRTRSLMAVWRRAIRLLHPGNRKGALAPSELALLRVLVERNGRQWAAIGRVMRRLPNALQIAWDRAAVAQDGGGRRAPLVGDWSADEERALEAAVRRLGTPAPDGGAGVVAVPWAAVSAALGVRTATQCRDKWVAGGFGARRLGLVWDAAADAALAAAVARDGGETSDEVDWAALLPGRPPADCRARFAELCKRLPGHAHTGFVERADALAAEFAAAAAAEAAAVAEADAAVAAEVGLVADGRSGGGGGASSAAVKRGKKARKAAAAAAADGVEDGAAAVEAAAVRNDDDDDDARRAARKAAKRRRREAAAAALDAPAPSPADAADSAPEAGLDVDDAARAARKAAKKRRRAEAAAATAAAR